jgi:mutator protein MutT
MSTERARSQPQSKEKIDAPIAIVVRDRRVLITQRKADDTLGGYWEFPGGKCGLGETLEQCLARELREEIDIVAHPLQRLTTIEHDYPAAVVRLHPIICAHVEGEPKLIECQAARWIDPLALRDYQFPPANDTLLDEVIKLLG